MGRLLLLIGGRQSIRVHFMQSTHRFSIFPAVAFLLLSSCMQGADAAELPAFPGAVGQGAQATGGRGGDVYHVTTLSDYSSDKRQKKIQGSLRHAIQSADGPRTIVFDVSGAIALERPLLIRKSRLTIAGQTSPGGVTLWGYPVNLSQCSDVVVRHLRVRLGDFHAMRPAGEAAAGDSIGNNDLEPSSANAIAVYQCERIVLDHVSASWGMDETLSVTVSRDVTVQDSLIAESLRRSFHEKGSHGYGSLIRGVLTEADRKANVGGYTLYRNLWAHHDARNPSLGGEQRLKRGQREEDRRSTDVNLVNCVVYNWGSQATHRSYDGLVRVNLLGNYYLNGPAKNAEYFFRGTNTGRTLLRHHGNMHDRVADDRQAGAVVVAATDGASPFRGMNEGDEVQAASPPFGFLGELSSGVTPAEEALAQVLRGVGASLWRDSADRRVVASLSAGAGRLVDSQEELRMNGLLPGIDDLNPERRPVSYDSDRDGMPDSFERKNGLAPEDPSDRNKTDLSQQGYTNLEVCLGQLSGEEIAP